MPSHRLRLSRGAQSLESFHTEPDKVNSPEFVTSFPFEILTLLDNPEALNRDFQGGALHLYENESSRRGALKSGTSEGRPELVFENRCYERTLVTSCRNKVFAISVNTS
jgi:hypothetical protein